ncbi:MAG TPA: redox-regulated ATPase YchF [Acidimicrobiales bacterium]|nr:redox-regulated ATPase YchF [Acidimicrobiales bacterium]
MERIGLVGLPNAGKSQLFNALTGAGVAVAPHPFTTTESAIGVAHVPDERLDALATMSESKKVVEAGVELVDIAGLVAGAERGEGLGNRFLAGIREVDALCFVLRSFADEAVPGSNDPVEALGILEIELVLADLATVEGQLERSKKAARVNPVLAGATGAMEAARDALQSGVPLYRSELSAEDREALVPLFLLTNKAFFCVVNIGEDEIGDEQVTKAVREELGPAANIVPVCVQLEAEAALLTAEERSELMEGLGLGAGAIPRVAQAAFAGIGRSVFFTTGPDESRAWTFRTGAHAPECAGVIHSDLQRGFIRAEVIHYDELLEIGSWNGAKQVGKLRLEGKDYEVLDGDVLEIRFNV